MDILINFIEKAPVWYKIFVFYMLMTIPSFCYLRNGALKEVEKLDDENKKASLDYVYLYISALLYPLIFTCNILSKLLLFLIDVLHDIVYLIQGVLLFCLGIVLGIIYLPFAIFDFNKKGDKKMSETKIMTKENVLLYEKHDIQTSEALNGEDGKTVMIKGVKIFRVIKPENGEFNVICQYLSETDTIDLSPLHDYVGWYMVSVDRDSYDNDRFVWNCVELGEGTETSDMFTIMNPRACTEEEVEMLNKLFPEYYDNAF